MLFCEVEPLEPVLPTPVVPTPVVGADEVPLGGDCVLLASSAADVDASAHPPPILAVRTTQGTAINQTRGTRSAYIPGHDGPPRFPLKKEQASSPPLCGESWILARGIQRDECHAAGCERLDQCSAHSSGFRHGCARRLNNHRKDSSASIALAAPSLRNRKRNSMGKRLEQQ